MRFFTTLLASSAAFLATPDAFIKEKDGHCDAAVIADACKALSGGASDSEVTLEQLATYFEGEKVFADEIPDWMARFKLSGDKVSCKQLCQKSVHMYAAQLPWTVDTGCKHVPSEDDSAKAVTVCDIDLDFEHLKALKFPDQQNHKDVVQDDDEHSGKGDEEELEVIFARMDKTVLRGFRSFPLADISADISAEGEAIAEKEGIAVPQIMEKKAASETPLEAEVETKVSAMLQLKQQAAPSFLQLQSAASAYSVACVHDAEFRSTSGLCPSFLDEQQVFAEIQKQQPKLAGASFEQSHEGCPSTCALTGHVAAGCEACSSFVQLATERVERVQARTGTQQWERDVAQVAMKASAYLNFVAKHMAGGHFSGEMQMWYGNNMPSTRQEVRRIINSVINLIDHVHYVYPGPRCSPNTYAYVFPNAGRGYTFTNDGTKFQFFLCPYYMKVDLGEQVETLTHEGSHHRQAYTDDVPHPTVSGQKAYGRSSCRTLARYNQASALKNADSFCYFVQDSGDRR